MSPMLRLSFLSSSVLFAAAYTSGAQAAGLGCDKLPELFQAYLVSHYSVRTMTDELKARTVEQYIKTLDGTKTLFLEEDVNKLKKDLKAVFESMKKGTCTQLEDAQKLLAQRAAENEAFVRAFLTADYKLDEKVEFMSNPDKRPCPKTKSDREELLKKFVHFQISNYTLADTKLPEAKNLLIHRYELITKRLKERKMDEVYDLFANAFAEGMDPHSTYFSKDRLEDFQIEMKLSLEGIGASLSSQDGYTVVEEIIPGGAADRAKKLMPKDKIVAVGQDGQPPVNVIDMDLRDVVKLIRGKKGTKVHLTILRQKEKTERTEVSIVRDKIDLADQAAKITFEKRKVGTKSLKFGIIDLPSFYGDTEGGKRSGYDDVKALLYKAKKEKVDGLVLNLSRNGGGLLDDAVRISGLFIKKGPIVATQNSRQNVDILADRDDSVAYAGPMVVLTSRVSASASEILAGALKDYKRALIVGADHTFGKGTVQAVIPLPKGFGAMKVTTGMFFVPSGHSTQHQGVLGDVTLPSVLNNEELGEKALDNSMLPNKIAAFLGSEVNAEPASPDHWKPVDAAVVKTVSSKSQERIAKDPKFAEIKKEIEEAAKSQGIVRLADLRSKGETEKKKKKEDEKKTLAQRIKDADAPIINETLNILSDLIQGQAGETPVAPAAPTAANSR